MLPILTCKQAARALADQDYMTLPWLTRTSLRFHVAICFVCHRYNRQIMQVQDCVRQYLDREDAALDSGPVKLSAACREKIRRACRPTPPANT
jgi:hypothetical protein